MPNSDASGSVAGGTGYIKAAIVAGLAEAKRIIQSIRRNPEFELKEMVRILEAKGIKKEDAAIIAKKLFENLFRGFGRKNQLKN